MSLLNHMKLHSKHQSGHNMLLGPGRIEEALNFMTNPGNIDLSDLTFYAVPYDDEQENEEESGDSNIDDDIPEETLLEIAIFALPPGCKNHNCILSEIGIGRMEENDGLPFLNPCDDKNGSLVIDETAFEGDHIQINVPRNGRMKKHVNKKLDAKLGGRFYEVLIANCNKRGREVKIDGQIVFEFAASNDHVDAASQLSSISPDTQFMFVAIFTFLFFVFCCFRVRIAPSSNSYERTPQQEEDDDVETNRNDGI